MYPADPVSRLKRKPYLKKLSIEHLNVISVGLGDQVSNLFSNCLLVQKSQGNMDRSLWHCGEVRVLDLDNITGSAEAKEELEIIMTGQREFGQPMRNSGPFSSLLLGRRYGRDDVWLGDQPHALIVGKAYDGPLADLQPVAASADGLKRMHRQIKANLFSHVQGQEHIAVVLQERKAQQKVRRELLDQIEELAKQLAECNSKR